MRRPEGALAGAGIVAASYVIGGVPFANLAARKTRGIDLRDVGTGTVSGTSLYRVAGFGPLAVAGVLEVAKGAPGVLAAGRRRPALAALAGGAAVVGHNWSPFLRGAGGRGLSPAIGALLARRWQGAVILLGGMVGGRMLRQTAVGSLVAQLALVPALAALDGGDGALTGAAVVAPMLVKRVVGNAPAAGRRVWVRRLLVDRDEWKTT
ncbi:MAG: glycerol-3-phosphate acyltransferase [Acidimicrobiales bacterium]